MCFRSCDEPDPMTSAGPDGRTGGEDNGAALGFCRMGPWPQSPSRASLIPSQFPQARNFGRRLDGNIEQWREAKTCPRLSACLDLAGIQKSPRDSDHRTCREDSRTLNAQSRFLPLGKRGWRAIRDGWATDTFQG